MKLLRCSLVRAYRGFEKQYVFSKVEKKNRITPANARKVRWVLVYSMLQTLRRATTVPKQVRDTDDVPYHLCVLTEGCPPWGGEEKSYRAFLRSQTDKFKSDWTEPQKSSSQNPPPTPLLASNPFGKIKPDIDYFALSRSGSLSRSNSVSSVVSPLGKTMKRGTVRRALSTLGNMPELEHPKPLRNSYHEILVHGYGNGLNPVSIVSKTESVEDTDHTTSAGDAPHHRHISLETASINSGNSPTWSTPSSQNSSPRSSMSSEPHSPGKMQTHGHAHTHSHTQDLLPILQPANGHTLVHKSSSIYSRATVFPADPPIIGREGDDSVDDDYQMDSELMRMVRNIMGYEAHDDRIEESRLHNELNNYLNS
jgi:hypothetical protein